VIILGRVEVRGKGSDTSRYTALPGASVQEPGKPASLNAGKAITRLHCELRNTEEDRPEGRGKVQGKFIP